LDPEHSGWVVLTVISASATVERRLSRNDHRVARTEEKLNAVLDHLGVVPTKPELDQVNMLVQQGQKVEAIKLYRETTGADLREAKIAVDRLADQR
jgi:ribosomal protein L7/L12